MGRASRGNLKQSVATGEAGEEQVPLVPFAAIPFRRKLQAWYAERARPLPWRGVDDPYATWVSEIMLQQTRVAVVLERYVAFIERFPDLAALARADEDDVLAMWSGLGYYRRARLLHQGARLVMRELGGVLPKSAARLRTLPGVGDYTAAAIASIAFGEPVAVLDGNVERVLLRLLGLSEDRAAAARTRLVQVAQALVPRTATKKNGQNPAGDHNQAMMELGATICLPRGPLCLECPVFDFCRTRGEHVTAPRGQQKSRTVAHLLALRKRGTATEVLLERRAADASLMPGMLELPPLPLEAVEGREPVLRLRHAITNTNYYVMIFSESAIGAGEAWRPEDPQLMLADEAPESSKTDEPDELVNEDEQVFVAGRDAPALRRRTLLEALVTAPEALEWFPTVSLNAQPLTGLTRKSLQRLGVMAVPQLRIASLRDVAIAPAAGKTDEVG